MLYVMLNESLMNHNNNNNNNNDNDNSRNVYNIQCPVKMPPLENGPRM